LLPVLRQPSATAQPGEKGLHQMGIPGCLTTHVQNFQTAGCSIGDRPKRGHRTLPQSTMAAARRTQ
jgi:hypothetical protein